MEIKPYRRMINYYETDQMHVVHHSNYARFLEEARLDLMNQAGLSYDKLEEMGIIIPVLELHDYYRDAIHYGDEIIIIPEFKTLSSVKFSLDYEIRDAKTDTLKHTAMTSHAFLDKDFKPMNMRKKFPDVYNIMESLLK